jgi:hypothetical protein
MQISKRVLTSGLLLIGTVLPLQCQGQAKSSAPTATQRSTCIGPSNKDANLDAIIREVFKNKVKELLEKKIVTQDFFENVRYASYEICDDRTWDAVAFPRPPPVRGV